MKDQIAQGNLKPSQLKRSKSTGDIPVSLPVPPLQKSQSQSEINLSEPEWQKEIASLKDELTIERKKVGLLREDLAANQAKLKAKEQVLHNFKTQISQLEEQILALRLKNLQDFDDYYTEKKALKGELETNIQAGTKEIKRLENQLLALNRKKLTLQSQLQQAELKNTRLELKMLDGEPKEAHSPWLNLNWVIVFSLGVVVLLTTKGENHD